MEDLTMYDMGIISILFLSSALALYKGFIKSLLSLSSLILSLILTYCLYPLIKPILSNFITNSVLAQIITGIGTYLISLIILSQLTSKINQWTENIRGGALDRILGLAFGFLRGYIICFIIYAVILSFTNIFYSSSQQNLGPKWLQNSVTTPLFKPFFNVIKQPEFENQSSPAKEESKNEIGTKFIIDSLKNLILQYGEKK